MFLIIFLVFISTLLVVYAGYAIINSRQIMKSEEASRRLAAAGPQEQGSLRKDTTVSAVQYLNNALQGRQWVRNLSFSLERAETKVRPGPFVLMMALLGMLGLIPGVMMGNWFLAIVMAGIGWYLPWFWLKGKLKKRVAEFTKQLPSAIDLLVSAMRTGYSFQSASQLIAQEVPAPLGSEFTRFYEEQRLGVDVRTALLDMQERIGGLDLKMFTTAVIVQRETGGNLSEVLSRLAELMRQRAAMKGKIEALVAEPKMSARFLGAMPIVVFVILSLINPGFMAPLRGTETGRMILMFAASAVTVGYMIMMSIADVDI